MESDDESESLEVPLSPVLHSNKRKCIKKCKNSTTTYRVDLSSKFGEVSNTGSRIHSSKENCINSLDDSSEESRNKSCILQEKSQKHKTLECNLTFEKTELFNDGFLTASGKPLLPQKSSSKFANNLFCDFFTPSCISKRKNKYNFLSKISNGRENSLSGEISPGISQINFQGFDVKECSDSKETLGRLQELVKAYQDVRVKWSVNFAVFKKNKRKCEDYMYHKRRKLCDHTDLQEQSLRYNNLNEISNCCDLDNIIQSGSNSNIFCATNTYKNNSRISTDQVLNTVTYGQTGLIVPKNYEDMKEINVDIENMASGKKFQITSDTAILKVKNVFKDIQDLNVSEKPRVSYSKENPKSYLASCNTEPQISKMQEITCEQTPLIQTLFSMPTLGPTSLFSTASGKKIAISTSSYEKVNTLFTKFDNLSNSDAYIPVSSAVTSSESSKNVQSIISTAKCQSRDETNLCFLTASGKKINVSEDCYSKVNHIFKDIPDLNNQVMPITETDKSKFAFQKVHEISSVIQSPSTQKINKTDGEIIVERNENYITPQRPIPQKKRLGSSLRTNRKLSDKALNRVKSLFGDINFDDLKLPSHLKLDSPSYISPKISVPIQTNQNRNFCTPYSSNSNMSTPIHNARRSFADKYDSVFNDFTQEYNCPLIIQKPTSGDLSTWVEELRKQKMVLEKKLSLISKKEEALTLQLTGFAINKAPKLEINSEKTMKMTLTDVKNLEMQSDVCQSVNNVILQINPQNASLVHFNGNWSEVPTVSTEHAVLVPNQHGLIGLSEIEAGFSNMTGIQKKLIPHGWVKNHYKWIIWKLASYERFFPATLGGCFDVGTVIKQLRHRYVKELYLVQRSSLRRIYEMDDVPQKRIILCVSNIFKNGYKVELELTDGWYGVRTLIDEPLCKQVTKRKIRIGTKLIISGAELLNCEGCYPLEVEQSQKVRLRIHFNSTRRAAWYSKLGYQKNPLPFFIRLDGAVSSGGIIGGAKLYILRTYPIIYKERKGNFFIWRNQNAEYKAIQKWESNYFRNCEDEASIVAKRMVTPVFQMTVIDCLSEKPKPYKYTIWDSADFHLEQLRENQIASFFNLTLRSNNEISSNKKTRFDNSSEIKTEYTSFRRKYVPLDRFDIMKKNSTFDEFDTVGFVIKIHIEESNQYFWLTDHSDNFLLVKINQGPEFCLLLNRVEEGQPVAVCNLTLRECRVEYVVATGNYHTIVTNHPNFKFLRDELDKIEKINKIELKNFLLDKIKRVQIFENDTSIQPSSSTPDGNFLNFSRVTTTDVVMSMIDIDEVVNNTK